jgi:hypothetical protein
MLQVYCYMSMMIELLDDISNQHIINIRIIWLDDYVPLIGTDKLVSSSRFRVPLTNYENGGALFFVEVVVDI